MNAKQLEKWILDNYQGITVSNAYRERSFFYNPDCSRPKGIYFATIKENDGPNDKSSHLDREAIFRLSMGIGKKHYQHLFGNVPQRPAKGGIVNLEFDFKALGILMPHPIYAWLGWVCINNPGKEQLETVKNLLDISYNQALLKLKNKHLLK